ncbi:hypothetical protein L211DRAFT_866888 [Terfezia boudieri ATCC MYA-4762]|uniref:Uncharacterized protein n=1 Tax=Terfezia boudieri ATCC MYA-4762 TaxID=1051890 RepID=A0A3N4LSS2_9PEZI|nr:hypothetical protein L211DRAFT_866888 [Terfezia boudieri ATCC MYA-4762]
MIWLILGLCGMISRYETAEYEQHTSIEYSLLLIPHKRQRAWHVKQNAKPAKPEGYISTQPTHPSRLLSPSQILLPLASQNQHVHNLPPNTNEPFPISSPTPVTHTGAFEAFPTILPMVRESQKVRLHQAPPCLAYQGRFSVFQI